MNRLFAVLVLAGASVNAQLTPVLQVEVGGSSYGTATGGDGAFVAVSGDYSNTSRTLKWYDSSGNIIYTLSGEYLSASFVSNTALLTNVSYNPTSYALHIKNLNGSITSFTIGNGTASWSYLPLTKDFQITFYDISGNVKIYQLSKINGAIASNQGLELPIDSVMLPANTSGSFSVQIEKSNDLISWSNADPGILGPGIYKRFYRIKVNNMKTIPCSIPEETTGNVLVNLESSSDLQNWLSANNGTYGSGSAKFFRLRIFTP